MSISPREDAPGVIDRLWSFITKSWAPFRDWLSATPGKGIAPRLPPRPVLVGLTLLLAVLAWLCVGNWPESGGSKPTLGLPADSGPPKLNEDQLAASLPPGENLEPAAPAKLESVESATPLPTGPAVIQRTRAELPPSDLPESDEPIHEVILALPHETEASMTRTPTNFALQMFLLGWFLSNPATPVLAGGTQEKKNEPTAGEVADRLGKIERDLNDLKASTNLKELREKLDGVSKALEALDKMPLQVQKHTKDIADLAEAIAELKQAVAKIQSDLASESRKAFSPATPREGTAVPSPTLTSTIRLVNAWSTPMTVVIEKDSYRLQPGEVRNVTRKAGNFAYEVLGVQPAVNRTLVAGESMTIRIGAPQ
jgi:hypothetical protein